MSGKHFARELESAIMFAELRSGRARRVEDADYARADAEIERRQICKDSGRSWRACVNINECGSEQWSAHLAGMHAAVAALNRRTAAAVAELSALAVEELEAGVARWVDALDGFPANHRALLAARLVRARTVDLYEAERAAGGK